MRLLLTEKDTVAIAISYNGTDKDAIPLADSDKISKYTERGNL